MERLGEGPSPNLPMLKMDMGWGDLGGWMDGCVSEDFVQRSHHMGLCNRREGFGRPSNAVSAQEGYHYAGLDPPRWRERCGG